MTIQDSFLEVGGRSCSGVRMLIAFMLFSIRDDPVMVMAIGCPIASSRTVVVDLDWSSSACKSRQLACSTASREHLRHFGRSSTPWRAGYGGTYFTTALRRRH